MEALFAFFGVWDLFALLSWDYLASYAPLCILHDSAQRFFFVTIEVVGYQIHVVFARCDYLCHEGGRVE